MKKNNIIISFLILLLLFSLNVSAEVENIKLGAIFNLTGAMASLEVPAKNGAVLAVKEINANGGVLGKQIKMYIEDGKTDVATVSNATEKLLAQEVSVLFGLCDTNYVLAAGGIAQNNKIPFVDVGGTMPSIPDLTGDYVFMGCIADNTEAKAIAKFAHDFLNARTAWTFKDTGVQCAVTVIGFFKDFFEELGGQVILEDTLQYGDIDFRAQITRLKQLDPPPDILVVSVNADANGIVVKQIREMGINIPILSFDGFDSPLLVEVARESADNVYFSTFVSFGSDDPMVQNFIEAYKKEYNRDCESAFAAAGYDAVYLIADAIKRAGSVEGNAVRIALGETKNLPGVTGTLSYEEGSRVPIKPVTIMEVMKGKVSYLKTVTP